MAYERWVFACHTCHCRQYVDTRGQCEALQLSHEYCDVFMGRATEVAW